jgi:hypothetical protein
LVVCNIMYGSNQLLSKTSLISSAPSGGCISMSHINWHAELSHKTAVTGKRQSDCWLAQQSLKEKMKTRKHEQSKKEKEKIGRKTENFNCMSSWGQNCRGGNTTFLC